MLKRLGQRSRACSSFTRLTQRIRSSLNSLLLAVYGSPCLKMTVTAPFASGSNSLPRYVKFANPPDSLTNDVQVYGGFIILPSFPGVIGSSCAMIVVVVAQRTVQNDWFCKGEQWKATIALILLDDLPFKHLDSFSHMELVKRNSAPETSQMVMHGAGTAASGETTHNGSGQLTNQNAALHLSSVSVMSDNCRHLLLVRVSILMKSSVVGCFSSCLAKKRILQVVDV